MFIPVSGCVGKGPSALLCPGAYNAVKTALLLPLPPSIKESLWPQTSFKY